MSKVIKCIRGNQNDKHLTVGRYYEVIHEKEDKYFIESDLRVKIYCTKQVFKVVNKKESEANNDN